MADEKEVAATVIDNGTGYIKAGMAGDQAPRKTFPTLHGKARFQGEALATDEPDYKVGQEAFEKRGQLNISKPIEKGIIKDWELMRQIWHHTFYNELKVDPQEHPVMITDSPKNTFSNKEKCTEVFFESLNVPSFYIASSAVLALMASGRTKGVVFDSGEGCSHVVPIYEAYALPHATEEIDISGSDLTKFMMDLLKQGGANLSVNDIYVAQHIKETTTHISLDYTKEEQDFKDSINSKDTTYKLPDGNSINIGLPQIQCPEALFKPFLIEKKHLAGIHDLIYKSYFAIDMEVRKQLFSQIVLAGGNTLFQNIGERIASQMKELGGNSIVFKVYLPAERQYTGWIGGSVLSSLSTFQNMWISKKDYEETGSSIVRKKCL